jgi:1,4-alpha-glucan branching enzyme
MSTDDRGDSPRGSGAADKDELQRVVEEKTARAEAVAGSEPVVNAAPAKKAAKRTAAKKAAPT